MDDVATRLSRALAVPRRRRPMAEAVDRDTVGRIPWTQALIPPRWWKVLRDLWGNKTRTVLVVLSIAVGVFGVGMIVGVQTILTREISAGYLAVNPSSAILYTEPPFDDELVQALARFAPLRAVEGRRSVTVRVQTGPQTWHNLRLFAIPDYDDIRVDQVRPQRGAWPPGAREVLIERNALGIVQADVGESLSIETPDGEQRSLHISGVAHDVNQFPAALAGLGYGYVAYDTLEWLGEPRSFNELHVVVRDNALDKQHVQDVVNQVQDKVEKSGRRVTFVYMPATPGQYAAYDIVQAMVVVLGILGVLALVLSGFLVTNTVGALITQQIRQIGVMKAIGARPGQVVTLYLGMALVYGLLALALALPLSIIGARVLSTFIVSLINFDIGSYQLSPAVLVLAVVLALVVPLVAAIVPVLGAARLSVREAINSYGLSGSGFEVTLFDRLIPRVSALPRPLLLSLRNTFRRRGRLLLTLGSLMLACAMVVAVFSVQAAVNQTVRGIMRYWQYDIEITFRQPYRLNRIVDAAQQVPGVLAAEAWGLRNVRRPRADETESPNIQLLAIPADTRYMAPVMVAGRWLLPGDENAVVIDSELLKTDPDIQVGDDIVLKTESREATWRVVGIARGLLWGPQAYVNYPYFARSAVYQAERGSRVGIITDRQSPAEQAALATALETQFKRASLDVSSTNTTSDYRLLVESQFGIVIVFLLLMAGVLALVGGIGLMGTLSINVLERTREIGVLRAIGASNGSVAQLVIVEGLLIGSLSWLAGMVVAYPLSRLLSAAVGMALIRTPLEDSFAWSGVAISLVVVIILATVASFLPAWNATRLSVRAALSYE